MISGQFLLSLYPKSRNLGVVQVPDEEADYVAIGLAANCSNHEDTRPEARPPARDQRQHKFRSVTTADERPS